MEEFVKGIKYLVTHQHLKDDSPQPDIVFERKEMTTDELCQLLGELAMNTDTSKSESIPWTPENPGGNYYYYFFDGNKNYPNHKKINQHWVVIVDHQFPPDEEDEA